MDNVTHAIAGLVLAETAAQLRARRGGTRADASPRLRTAAAVASMVAANLPDSDLFYTGVGGDRLGYMLHHRGHTHTVVLALVGAALLWAVVSAAWRWRTSDPLPREDSRWLFGLLLAGTLSHLALDWTNSYGVHPFWPADDRWFYGDAVFIIEPWFWVIAVPSLVAASTRRAGRVVLSLILALGLALAWRVPQVTTGAAIALTGGAIASVALARRLRPAARAAFMVAAWVTVTLTMAAGSAAARGRVLEAVRAADPSAEVLDVVMTPLPANPLCTTAITVERSGGTYRVATARATGAPSLGAVTRCGSRDGAGPMFRVSPRASTAAVQWDTEWIAPAVELATLARESCPALAALRFIRVPAWRAVGDSVMLGDVRYGGGSGRGFSDVLVPRRSAACPASVPSWTPPRSDLLTGAGE